MFSEEFQLFKVKPGQYLSGGKDGMGDNRCTGPVPLNRKEYY